MIRVINTSFCLYRVNHSNNAIVKPPELTPQAAAKELEIVMKRVREAQSTIAAAIEPGTTCRFFYLYLRFSVKIMKLCRVLILRLLSLLQQTQRNVPPVGLEDLAAPARSPARAQGHAGKGRVRNTGANNLGFYGLPLLDAVIV